MKSTNPEAMRAMEKLRAELSRLIEQLYEGENKVLVYGEGSVGARVMLHRRSTRGTGNAEKAAVRWQSGQKPG